jgi:hypothetical protein
MFRFNAEALSSPLQRDENAPLLRPSLPVVVSAASASSATSVRPTIPVHNRSSAPASSRYQQTTHFVPALLHERTAQQRPSSTSAGLRLHLLACMTQSRRLMAGCAQALARAGRFSGSTTWASAIAFLLAVAVYVGVGMLCIVNSTAFPVRGVSEARHTAHCLEAHHHPHHAEVRVFLGTPLQAYRLLVRMDASTQCGTEATSFASMTLINSKVLHSRSVHCTDERQLCHDVAIVSRWHGTEDSEEEVLYDVGASQHRTLLPVGFHYGVRELAGYEALQLELDGELYLCRGTHYVLSARELCSWPLDGDSSSASPSASSSTSAYATCARPDAVGWLPVERLGEGLTYNRFGASTAALRAAGGAWSAAPAAHESCDATASEVTLAGNIDAQFVELFSTAAVLPQTFWALETNAVDEIAAMDRAAYDAFRVAVEVGGRCARRRGEDVATARVTFELLCGNTALLDGWGATRAAHCTETEKVVLPYSRVSDHRLDMRVDGDGRACFTLTPDAALRTIVSTRLGRASSAGTNTMSAIVKLLCVVLAAAVAWARREDATDRADAIFGRCVALVRRGAGGVHVYDVDAQTMLLGLLAALTRTVIACASMEALRADRLGRVATSELLLSASSLAHWFVLYTGELFPSLGWIKRRGLRPALGGSSALVDVCCATMIAFTTPPVRVDTTSFDVIARLLTAVLLSITCVSRCFLSSACGGLFARAAVLATTRETGSKAVDAWWQARGGMWLTGLSLGALAVLFWVAQAAGVAIVLVDLFAVPFAIDFTRSSTGGRTLNVVGLFLGTSLFCGPRLTANAILVARRVHGDGHNDRDA